MPNSKTKGAGGKPILSIKKDEKSPKSRVEEMFGGTADVNKGEGPSMEVTATIPLPEHAEADPDHPSVRDIKDRVEGLFSSIGTAALPETLFPSGPKNNGTQAAEFVVSEQLKKLAEKRYERAKAEAEAVGCFGDKAEYRPGETVEVYRTAGFTFSVQKNADSKMIDRTAVEQLLRDLFPSKWKEMMDRIEKPKAGATRFIVALR
jgi:hypothetical protein